MGKEELIEKAAEGIEKVANTANSKTLALCLIVSLFINGWQWSNNVALTKKILSVTENLQEKRIEELKGIVQGEVQNQMQPIAQKVGTIQEAADSTFRNINEKLQQ